MAITKTTIKPVQGASPIVLHNVPQSITVENIIGDKGANEVWVDTKSIEDFTATITTLDEYSTGVPYKKVTVTKEFDTTSKTWSEGEEKVERAEEKTFTLNYKGHERDFEVKIVEGGESGEGDNEETLFKFDAGIFDGAAYILPDPPEKAKREEGDHKYAHIYIDDIGLVQAEVFKEDEPVDSSYIGKYYIFEIKDGGDPLPALAGKTFYWLERDTDEKIPATVSSSSSGSSSSSSEELQYIQINAEDALNGGSFPLYFLEIEDPPENAVEARFSFEGDDEGMAVFFGNPQALETRIAQLDLTINLSQLDQNTLYAVSMVKDWDFENSWFVDIYGDIIEGHIVPVTSSSSDSDSDPSSPRLYIRYRWGMNDAHDLSTEKAITVADYPASLEVDAYYENNFGGHKIGDCTFNSAKVIMKSGAVKDVNEDDLTQPSESGSFTKVTQYTLSGGAVYYIYRTSVRWSTFIASNPEWVSGFSGVYGADGNPATEYGETFVAPTYMETWLEGQDYTPFPIEDFIYLDVGKELDGTEEYYFNQNPDSKLPSSTPATWADKDGWQSQTWSYTENGRTVTAQVGANITALRDVKIEASLGSGSLPTPIIFNLEGDTIYLYEIEPLKDEWKDTYDETWYAWAENYEERFPLDPSFYTGATWKDNYRSEFEDFSSLQDDKWYLESYGGELPEDTLTDENLKFKDGDDPIEGSYLRFIGGSSSIFKEGEVVSKDDLTVTMTRNDDSTYEATDYWMPNNYALGRGKQSVTVQKGSLSTTLPVTVAYPTKVEVGNVNGGDFTKSSFYEEGEYIEPTHYNVHYECYDGTEGFDEVAEIDGEWSSDIHGVDGYDAYPLTDEYDGPIIRRVYELKGITVSTNPDDYDDDEKWFYLTRDDGTPYYAWSGYRVNRDFDVNYGITTNYDSNKAYAVYADFLNGEDPHDIMNMGSYMGQICYWEGDPLPMPPLSEIPKAVEPLCGEYGSEVGILTLGSKKYLYRVGLEPVDEENYLFIKNLKDKLFNYGLAKSYEPELQVDPEEGGEEDDGDDGIDGWGTPVLTVDRGEDGKVVAFEIVTPSSDAPNFYGTYVATSSKELTDEGLTKDTVQMFPRSWFVSQGYDVTSIEEGKFYALLLMKDGKMYDTTGENELESSVLYYADPMTGIVTDIQVEFVGGGGGGGTTLKVFNAPEKAESDEFWQGNREAQLAFLADVPKISADDYLEIFDYYQGEKSPYGFFVLMNDDFEECIIVTDEGDYLDSDQFTNEHSVEYWIDLLTQGADGDPNVTLDPNLMSTLEAYKGKYLGTSNDSPKAEGWLLKSYY